jgi:hypothetical protein
MNRDFAQVLERAPKGSGKAAEDLLPLVYDELRRLAAAKMSHEPPGQTLQATALVHEAWLKLASISTERDLPNTGPPAGHQWPVYVVNRRWWSGHQGTGTARSHRPEASTIGR